jgi:hypothetical protein
VLDTRRAMVVLVISCGVAACDGGFRARGTVVSADAVPLEHCTLSLQPPAGGLACCDGPVDPTHVNTLFTVPPSAAHYTLACPGFRPYVREVVYGTDVSPSRPLNLGVVVLQPVG